MGNGIYSALSGAITEERRVEMLSHNLANINTSGFKQFRMALESVQGPPGNDEMSFATPAQIKMDLRGGPLVSTGNPMDLALTQGVYMAVQDNGAESYQRGGTMIVRPDGHLITESGSEVMGHQKPVIVPPGAKTVEISADGKVIADGDEVGEIKLVRFEDESALKEGPGKTMTNPGDAAVITEGIRENAIMAGYIEEANISAVQGMTELIAAHRSYDAAAKTIDVISKIEKRTAKELGK